MYHVHGGEQEDSTRGPDCGAMLQEGQQQTLRVCNHLLILSGCRFSAENLLNELLLLWNSLKLCFQGVLLEYTNYGCYYPLFFLPGIYVTVCITTG